MAEAALTLPSFDRPPVGEVALLAQFDALDEMTNADFCRLWAETEFRELYPKIEEYDELPPFREVFGVRRRPKAQALKWEYRPTVLRYNFRSEDRKEQIQVQRDRVGFYWQGGRPAQTYPRFPAVLENFRRDFGILDRFLRANALGQVMINQCAISYTNVIPRGDGWNTPEELANVVTFWQPQYNQPLQPDLTLEDVNALMTYVVLQDGKKLARMYVGLSPTLLEPDDTPAVELKLIVRGAPMSADLDGILKFFEMGRQRIVTTFEAVVTPSMNTLWGKQ